MEVVNNSCSPCRRHGQTSRIRSAPGASATVSAKRKTTRLFSRRNSCASIFSPARATDLAPGGVATTQAEEHLAEDFINYKNTGKIMNGARVRNTLFRKLINFIKDLLKLDA